MSDLAYWKRKLWFYRLIGNKRKVTEIQEIIALIEQEGNNANA